MAKFPISESKIASLAGNVIAGLKTETDDFPSLAAAPDQLQDALDAYRAAQSAAVAAADEHRDRRPAFRVSGAESPLKLSTTRPRLPAGSELPAV